MTVRSRCGSERSVRTWTRFPSVVWMSQPGGVGVRHKWNAVPRASAAVGDHATQPDGRPLLTVDRSQNFCGSTSRTVVELDRRGKTRPDLGARGVAAWLRFSTWDDNGPRIGTAWRRSRDSGPAAGVDDGRGGCRRVSGGSGGGWNNREVEIRHTNTLRRIYQADRSWRATASRLVRSTSSIAAGCETRFTTQDGIRRRPAPSPTSLTTITTSAMRCRL
jgi:hypothetical protein